MNKSHILPANYRDPGVSLYRGNPLIETLPPLRNSRADYLAAFRNYPKTPLAKDRKKGEMLRLLELPTLSQILHPFPEYADLEIKIASLLRESYLSRNPIDQEDVQRRHAIAAEGKDGVPFPKNWKSTGKGYLLTGLSGLGKTTFIDASLLRYPQVYEHKSYNGSPLSLKQVVWLKVRIPHDGTLKGFCVQFCQAVDRLLGTQYEAQAHSIGRISPMISLMRRVASTISLGLLVVDELQNLKYARGGQSEFMLNLFGELTEQLGTAILLIGTPAVQSLFADSVRNVRKICSAGSHVIRRMKVNDGLWQSFCEVLWHYQWVKSPAILDDEILKTWYRYSQGVTAFAVLLFSLAQHAAIGEREVVDADMLKTIAKRDMAFLQPALRALASNDPRKLIIFDDLMFTDDYHNLQKLAGFSQGTDFDESDGQEFDDVSSGDKPGRQRKSPSKMSSTAQKPLFETDDPFDPDW